MSVSCMKLVRISGYPFSLESGYDTLDAVLTSLEETGVFQPTDSRQLYGAGAGLLPIQCSDPYGEPLRELETAVQRSFTALELPPPALEGGTPSDIEDPAAAVSRCCEVLSQQADRYQALRERCEKARTAHTQLEHFRDLDADIHALVSCATVKVRFGRLPSESYEKLQRQNKNPLVMFFPAHVERDYCWGIYFAPLAKETEIDRIFFNYYFERLEIEDAVGTPSAVLTRLQEEYDACQREQEALRAAFLQEWEQRQEEVRGLYARLAALSHRVQLRHHAAQREDSFILSGWVPRGDVKRVTARLKAIKGVEFQCSDPDSTHGKPPVRLRNNPLVRPFEFLVDMYGLPRYGEPDPTPFVAVTYTLLFGIMFGDVGQGLIVSLIGWLMWKLKNMDIGRILVPCGFASALFGLVFGSVFGFEEVLNPFYRALGFREKPLSVMDQATTVILLAVAVGLIIIIASMLLNIFSGLRRRDYGRALLSSSGIAGLTFFVSLIVGVAGQLLLKWHLLSPLYIIGLLILPLIAMFLEEPLGKLLSGDPHWMPESWGEFFLQSFFELFETMLSYVSNTMSFLRVGAFVLVHAGMMLAVFSIADMFGTFGYTVAVVLGNGLVMVMEALLVAIQVMRLEFYEMFSRYYIGDGDPFVPLGR